jgi:hypothetical protein
MHCRSRSGTPAAALISETICSDTYDSKVLESSLDFMALVPFRLNLAPQLITDLLEKRAQNYSINYGCHSLRMDWQIPKITAGPQGGGSTMNMSVAL